MPKESVNLGRVLESEQVSESNIVSSKLFVGKHGGATKAGTSQMTQSVDKHILPVSQSDIVVEQSWEATEAKLSQLPHPIEKILLNNPMETPIFSDPFEGFHEITSIPVPNPLISYSKFFVEPIETSKIDFTNLSVPKTLENESPPTYPITPPLTIHVYKEINSTTRLLSLCPQLNLEITSTNLQHIGLLQISDDIFMVVNIQNSFVHTTQWSPMQMLNQEDYWAEFLYCLISLQQRQGLLEALEDGAVYHGALSVVLVFNYSKDI